MGCTNSKQKQADKYILDEFDDTIKKISLEELNMLKMIYFDLALRNGNKKIQKQIFFIFFQKNGLWGHRLYREFDMDDSGFVCLQEFVVTTAKIIKADEDAKICLLYQFFAFGNEDKQDGIIFSDFLRVLYNYSKEQLKSMLQAQYKVDIKLKEELLAVLNEFDKKNSNNPKNKDNHQICLEMKDRSDSITQSGLFQILDMKDIKSKKNLSSCIGKPFNKPPSITQNRRPDAPNKNTNDRFQTNNDNNIENSTNNFTKESTNQPESQRDYRKKNLKPESGLLLEVGTPTIHSQKKQARLSLITSMLTKKLEGCLNSILFNGSSCTKIFNQHIWEMKDGKFRYLSKQPQIQSKGKYIGHLYERGQMSKKIHMKQCRVFLQGSVLFLSDEQNKQNLYNVIYLEGLEVSSVREEKFGYGIQIRHKLSIYPKKNIFFEDEVTSKKWMQHLKDYKGFNVHEKYQMGMRIGAGKYSIVCECRERQNNKRYAMKQIDTFRLTSQEKSIISHQSNIMSGFDHPNLLKFRQTIKAKNKIFIITELVQGKDLSEFVKEQDILMQSEAADIAKQIINGVNYMHRMGIVHRDLKPENIMIDINHEKSQNRVKIIDFGFANYLKNMEVVHDDDAIVGTPNFIAPEVYRKQRITEKADIFSIGAIIYFMLSGEFPFHSDNLEFLVERTLTEKVGFVGKKWSKVSKQAKNLIQRFLQVDVSERITLKDALSHCWFRTAANTIPESETFDSKKEVSIGSKKLYIY